MNKVAQVNNFLVLDLSSSRAQVVFCWDTQLRMQPPRIVLIHVFEFVADKLWVLLRLVQLLHTICHYLDFFRRVQFSKLGRQVRLSLTLRVQIDMAVIFSAARVLIDCPTKKANVVQRCYEKLPDLLSFLDQLYHTFPLSVVYITRGKSLHLTFKMISLKFRALDCDHLKCRCLNINVEKIFNELFLVN